MKPTFTFIFPGDPETLTGGYTYGRRIVETCRSLGAAVTTLALPDGFPFPSPDTVVVSERILGTIPDKSVVVFDGLAFSALPDLAAAHAVRLRLVALVHHPLADETGLTPAQRDRFFDSEKSSLSHAERVIVSSSFTKNRLADFGVRPEKCSVVEPGIDIVEPNSPRPEDGPVQLLFVASLTPRKGHLDLFAALETIDTANWSLDLVGPSDLDSEYGQIVLDAASTFGDRVRYHGALPESELAALYRSAVAYVSPAKYEGYGMALATAVMHGLPVLAVDGGAVGSTPAGAAARLVPVDEPHRFAQALQSLIADRKERQMLVRQSHAARGNFRGWVAAGRMFLDALSEG